MALLNIGAGNRDDAFYRYKMPRMITKIEGRGNGIKTNIVNMVDIAKALGRPASYTTKYFGTELGAQSKYDEKMGTSHVNGAHETSKLSALLEVFINKYVQCYGCGNPETEILITKSHMIALKCAACGFISEVDMRDKLTTFIVKNPPEQKKGSKDKKAMRRAEKERLKEGEMADEEQKKLKKDVRKKSTPKSLGRRKTNPFDEDSVMIDPENEASVDENNGNSEDEVEWQTDTSAEAALQRIQEQLNSVTAGMVVLSTGEENSESDKVSPTNSPSRDAKHKMNGMKSVKSRDKLLGLKSVKSRDKLNDEGKGSGKANQKMRSAKSRENLQDGIKNSGKVGHKLRTVSSSEYLSDGMKDNRRGSHRLSRVSSRDSIVDEMNENAREESELRAVNSQEHLVVEIKDYLKKGPPAVEELKPFLGSLSGTNQEISDALFEALFIEVGKGFSKEVAKQKNFLAAATPDESSQLVLLHSIEAFCDKACPDARKEIALVLKSLYDNDVLEESFILEWYNKGIIGENKDSAIWKNVKPFVEWLQSAESETEGE